MWANPLQSTASNRRIHPPQKNKQLQYYAFQMSQWHGLPSILVEHGGERPISVEWLLYNGLGPRPTSWPNNRVLFAAKPSVSFLRKPQKILKDWNSHCQSSQLRNFWVTILGWTSWMDMDHYDHFTIFYRFLCHKQHLGCRSSRGTFLTVNGWTAGCCFQPEIPAEAQPKVEW